jgi:hypothetical protein
MANVFKKGMLATTGTPGIKIAQYEMTGIGTTPGLTIRASDLDLSTIMWADIKDQVDSTAVKREYRVGIGTFTDGQGAGNYATVRAVTSGSAAANIGTTIQIMAIGM